MWAGHDRLTTTNRRYGLGHEPDRQARHPTHHHNHQRWRKDPRRSSIGRSTDQSARAEAAEVVQAIEDRLELRLNISEECHFMGAIGAALFGLDHILAARKPTSQSARPAEATS